MSCPIQKKREEFAKKIRSESKQAYFQKERKKLIQAQKEGDIDLEGEIIASLIDLLGSQEQVHQTLKMYEEYELSREQYERKLQEDEEASIDFQRLQDMKKRQENKAQLLALFEQLEEQENQKEEIKDIEI